MKERAGALDIAEQPGHTSGHTRTDDFPRGLVPTVLWQQDMETQHCPNYDICQLVHTASVVSDPQKRRFYLDAYCLDGDGAWKGCKRYVAKNALDFCPEFVLPDSPLTPSEIIDRFDQLSDETP